MSIESQIQALAEKAAPLRALHDDDPRKIPLAGIIDQINALRKEQEQAVHLGAPPMENPRTGPTSTRVIDANAVIEGSDAAPDSIEAMVAESERVAHQEQAVAALKRKPGRPAKAKP